MKPLPDYLRHLALIVSLLFLAACSEGENHAAKAASIATLDVYKSRTCQCCQQWVRHMEDSGFETKIHHPADLNRVKDEHGIATEYQSCHTAVTSDGYVFEGHIPARFMQQFLANPPADGIGLTVPAMPVGSPGMEVGDKFMPYRVLLMKKDGSTEVFASVESAAQQVQPLQQPEAQP